MIATRDEIIKRSGFIKGQFDGLFDLWSQHTHILPLSFYRLEANGRGCGIENETDRTYIGEALNFCADIFGNATNLLVDAFPDVEGVRKGIHSRFSPGPRENLPPKNRNVQGHSGEFDQKLKPLAQAVQKFFKSKPDK